MSNAPRVTELRAGGAQDLPAVATIMAEAFDPRFGEAWTSAQCMGMLAMPGASLTLALHDGALTGFALARSIAGEAELLLLAVRPLQRGRGIGAALLRSVIAEAQTGAQLVERLHLEVRAGNPAVALYRAHGFEQVGLRRAYYRGPDGQTYDALTFARTIV